MKAYSPEEQHKRMTQTPVSKLVLSLALPTVISQMITVVYNTADTWFVSQIGTSASAAVGIVFSIMAIIQAFGFGISMGTGSLLSIYLGEKDQDKAEVIAASGLVADIVMGIFVGVIGLLFNEPLMRILGSTDSMLPYACDYAKYIFLGAPLMCGSFILSSILKAEGEAKITMVGFIISGLVNLVLDPIFIFIFDMGTGGAALATIISQGISCIIFIFAFLKGKSIVKLKISNASRNPKTYFKIITTGVPTICRQSLGSVASALLNRQAVIYGEAAVAAITIATKVYVLIRNMLIGVGQGFQPVAGYNFGAGNRKRTGDSFWWATIYGTVLCVIATIFCGAFSEQIIEWFRDDPEVVEIGTRCLKYLCAAMPVLAFSTFVNQLYQCLGFRAKATFLASCRQGIFFIPTLYILAHFFGIKSIEMTQALADVITCIISIPFLILFFKKTLRRCCNVSSACGQTSSENN